MPRINVSADKPVKNKRGWPAGAKALLAAGLLLAAWLAHYFYANGMDLGFGDNREWHMTDTEKGVAYDFDAGISFYSHNAEHYYFCTKDGMRSVTSGGEIRWQEMFSLTDPILTAKNDVVAVGDSRGNIIYVFDANGLAYPVSLEGPALYFSVNEAGYLAVIVQLDQGYAVSVYNRGKYTEPYFHDVIRDEMRQPISVGVSPDGKYAAIAMLDTRVHMESRVLFYYMNQSDSWQTEDGFFAGENFYNQIAYHVEFMADSRAVVVTDERVVCFQPGESNTLNTLWTVELHNQINQLCFYGGTRFAYVTGDKFLNDDEASDPGVVNIYSIDGQRTGEFPLGRKSTFLSMNRDALIVGADRAFYALDGNGNRLWDYTSLQDTAGIWFLDDTNTVLMAGGMKATVLKRERARAEETPEDPVLAAEE